LFDWITWSVWAVGFVILIVWIIVPIQEFRDMWRRMQARHRGHHETQSD
jgi:uncharacterized membrane protein YcjF (UPF0283 family)